MPGPTTFYCAKCGNIIDKQDYSVLRLSRRFFTDDEEMLYDQQKRIWIPTGYKCKRRKNKSWQPELKFCNTCARALCEHIDDWCK